MGLLDRLSGTSLGFLAGDLEKGTSAAAPVGDWIGDRWNDVTGVTSGRAAKSAAELEAEAAEKARQQIEDIYTQNREDMLPWLESGKKNLSYLDQLMGEGYFEPEEFNFSGFQEMGDVSQTPGYQFRLGQGTQAIDRGAAAKGGLRSGATDIDLMKFGQGFASNEYQKEFDRNRATNQDRFNREYNTFGANRAEKGDYFNRLSGAAGRGQTQSQALGNLGSRYGGDSANLITGGANALASGIVGGANARTQGTQNLLNMLMQGGALAFG